MSSRADLAADPEQGIPSPSNPEIFTIRPLIVGSITALYVTLTLPLIALTARHMGELGAISVGIGILIGLAFLMAVLSQRVCVTVQGLSADYPRWVPPFLRQSWTVAWSTINRIEASTTGQGGLVYYLVTQTGSSFLIPLRITQLPRLLFWIQHYTGLETISLRPYVQTWMYGLLATCAALMATVDVGLVWLWQQVP